MCGRRFDPGWVLHNELKALITYFLVRRFKDRLATGPYAEDLEGKMTIAQYDATLTRHYMPGNAAYY